MINMLTRYERARVISARALQISMGAPILMKDKDEVTSSKEIAEEEFNQGVLPISVVRRHPNGEEEIVKVGGK